MTIGKLYSHITAALIDRHMTVTTMESCTAGLIASLLTDTAGASAALKGAFVTYSNEAKIKMGVPAAVIEQYGVYSEETAAAMATACRSAYGADIGVGVTGTFQNTDPANPAGIPGEVFFAVDRNGKITHGFLTVPPCERHAAKLAVAEEVARCLLNLLTKETEK